MKNQFDELGDGSVVIQLAGEEESVLLMGPADRVFLRLPQSGELLTFGEGVLAPEYGRTFKVLSINHRHESTSKLKDGSGFELVITRIIFITVEKAEN